MISKQRGDQISAGVFLIGLGLLFTNILPFFPGILLILGAAAMARGVAEGHQWFEVTGALWLFGIGLFFWLNFSLPVLLIIIGLAMLFGYNLRPRQKAWATTTFRNPRLYADYEKPKHDEKLKHDNLDYRQSDNV
jgi:predicted membrane protein